MNAMIHPDEERSITPALNPVVRRRINLAQPAPNRPRLDLAARAQAAIQPSPPERD